MNPTISESQIQQIISDFTENIQEYEIIDMERYKGWSSQYLYLLVSADNNYILKGKTAEQIDGYDNEVKVSEALIKNNIESRKPIMTTEGNIFLQKFGYYWCLMTYIPGAPSHVNEYDENTVKSLAEHINQYVVASMVDANLNNLNLKPPAKQNSTRVLEQFYGAKESLEKLGILKGGDIQELFNSIKNGRDKYLTESNLVSIIHNDINPRNILIDHTTRNVIALIDWDHVRYANPLKDISDAISIFYDFLPLEMAQEYRKLFYKSFTTEWFTNIDARTVDFAFLFYYSVAKWRAILFYLDLLNKYDNQYGEKDRFINEMQQNYTRWTDTVSSL